MRMPAGARTVPAVALMALAAGLMDPVAGHGVPAVAAPAATLAMAATGVGEAMAVPAEARVAGSRAGIVIRDTTIAFMSPTTRAVVLMAATVRAAVRAADQVVVRAVAL